MRVRADVAVLQAIVASFKLSKAIERTVLERRKRSKTLSTLDGAAKLHSRARGPHPLYQSRETVPDDLVPWAVKWEDYTPTQYTAEVVLNNDRDKVPDEDKPKRGWADPDLPFDEQSVRTTPFREAFRNELRKRTSFEQRMGARKEALADPTPTHVAALVPRGYRCLRLGGQPHHAHALGWTRYHRKRPSNRAPTAVLCNVELLAQIVRWNTTTLAAHSIPEGAQGWQGEACSASGGPTTLPTRS